MPLGHDVPELYRGIAARAEKSRPAAVKLFCLECVGYVRQDVTDCTAKQCPLYPWLPYQNVATPSNRKGNAAVLRRYREGVYPDTPENEIDGQSPNLQGVE